MSIIGVAFVEQSRNYSKKKRKYALYTAPYIATEV